MVKYFDSTFTYPYSFPAVTLAFYLRYPNPFSTHVLSTDTISTDLDPETNRLTTVRLHHKRSRLPPAILKLLPKSVLGNVSGSGSSSSYILEKTEIDVREGWMKTESRNLDWIAILSVVERQTFSRDVGALTAQELMKADVGMGGTTDVTTSVKFRSRLGERIRDRVTRRGEEQEGEEKKGLFATWTTAGVQRSIEAIASRRGVQSQGNSKQGMTVVLERLRNGGLMGVLDGMRKDREAMFAEGKF